MFILTFIERLFLKLYSKFIKKRPLFFIDVPEGKVEPQTIKVKSIKGYEAGKSDIIVTISKKTIITGNKDQPHCIKIEGSIVGDGLTIYNYGVLNPWYNVKANF